MSRRRTLAGLAMLGALAGAGMVSAQPTPQQQGQQTGQPPLLQPPAPAQPTSPPMAPASMVRISDSQAPSMKETDSLPSWAMPVTASG